MSRTDWQNHISPKPLRPGGAVRQFERGAWRALCLVLALVFLANLALVSAATRTGSPETLSIAAASAPSGDPCGSRHGALHDHALCCSSASCSVFVPVDVAVVLAQHRPAPSIAVSDLSFSSHAPPALFHPPKLLVIA